MRKSVKRALVCAVAAVSAAGLMLAAGCGNNTVKLEGDISGEVVSNGGFAVEKGNYVYFINGSESNTAENTYGEVHNGALMRIAKSDLAAANYSNVETVVPLVMYSENYDGGIYIYGDYVYFSTPSSAKDSGGVTLNSRLEFKRAKLDGSEVMSDFYFQSETADLDYRFVENDGKVYLLYALSETLYGEDEYTNIHAVDLETREDTLIAYNVSSYMFDTDDSANGYVYYTMDVTYNLGTDNEVAENYNQIYRASATSATNESDYDFSYIEDYDAEVDPVYVNRGEMVFDGIGREKLTQFNYGYDASNPEAVATDANTLSGYTYELVSYENGTLYYTIETDGDPVLLYVQDSAISAEGWNPITSNPKAENTYGENLLLINGSSVSNYTFMENGEGVPVGVIYVDNGTIISASFKNGVIADEMRMTSVSADNINILNISEETANVNGEDDGTEQYTFLYYGVTGEVNSYSVHRIALGGTAADYMQYPADDSTSNYKDVKILDLDVAANWYMPEILAGHLLFASNTDDMVNYEYIMAFDLRPEGAQSADAATMSNAQIEEINDLYDSIVGEEDSAVENVDEDYEYLPDALRYAFITGDGDYIFELCDLWEESDSEDAEAPYSEQERQLVLDFITPAEGNGFAQFADMVKKINGNDVYVTSRNYFYNMLGEISEDEKQDYLDELRVSLMRPEPTEEEEEPWFNTLSDGEKAGFIIGVCVGGILVIVAAIYLARFIIARKKKRLPVYRKSTIKVDTTDDKAIDVYGDGKSEEKSEDNK